MLTHEYDGKFEFAAYRYFKPPPLARWAVTSPPWLFEPTPEFSMSIIRDQIPNQYAVLSTLDDVRSFFEDDLWMMSEPEAFPPITWLFEGRRRLPWNKRRGERG
jgi:hypothetical protein